MAFANYQYPLSQQQQQQQLLQQAIQPAQGNQMMNLGGSQGFDENAGRGYRKRGNGNKNANTPTQNDPNNPNNASTANVNLGGGWDTFGKNDAQAQKLLASFNKGLTGEAAVKDAGVGAYYPDSGMYGLEGSYIAPNQNGQLDLIQRTPHRSQQQFQFNPMLNNNSMLGGGMMQPNGQANDLSNYMTQMPQAQQLNYNSNLQQLIQNLQNQNVNQPNPNTSPSNLQPFLQYLQQANSQR